MEIALEILSGLLLEILSSLLNPWAIEAIVYLILAVILGTRSNDARTTTGARQPPKPGDESGTGCPKAGITIINNMNCCTRHTRSKAAVRRRGGRSARRRPLRRRNADQNEA